MGFLVVLLGCVFLIEPAVAGESAPIIPDSGPFDCRRAGQECYSNEDTCNRTSPICECGGSVQREGAACDIITDQINGTNCATLDCGNGTCVSDGENATCVCEAGYYGEACDIEYIFVVCDRNGMKVFFNPHGDFGGRIYVKDKRNESTCHAVPLPPAPRNDPDIDDKYEGYYIDLRHNDSVCGPVLPVEDGDTTSVTRTFIIHYLQIVMTGFDQRIIARCYFKNDEHLVSGGDIIVDNDLSRLDEEEVEDMFSPISVELTHVNDGSAVNLSAPILVDTEIYVTLFLEEAHGAVEVNEIKFNSSDDYEWIIFSDGCEHDHAASIRFSRPEYPDGNKTVVRFSFSTFYVFNHDSVSLWIKTSTCLDPSQCNLVGCQRKKRSAEDKLERDVEVTLLVYQSNGERNDGGSATEVSCTGAMCLSKQYFIPLVVGIAGACLLLAFIAVLLCIVLKRRRPKEMWIK